MSWCAHCDVMVYTCDAVAHTCDAMAHTHVMPWRTHVMLWCTHVMPWRTHVMPWCTHVILWGAHVMLLYTHVIPGCTHVMLWRTHCEPPLQSSSLLMHVFLFISVEERFCFTSQSVGLICSPSVKLEYCAWRRHPFPKCSAGMCLVLFILYLGNFPSSQGTFRT